MYTKNLGKCRVLKCDKRFTSILVKPSCKSSFLRIKFVLFCRPMLSSCFSLKTF